MSRRGSPLAREVRGGLTTFMAMAYILLLNPLILSGRDAAGDRLGQQALITATAFALRGGAVSTPDFSLFGHVEFGGWGRVGAMTVGPIVFTLLWPDRVRRVGHRSRRGRPHPPASL